jgi:glucosamine--fructose-6-phosphate aminotransferase (isomerizing)
MNLRDAKYNRFALVREMLQTPDIVRHFDFGPPCQLAEVVQKRGKLFLTGEGSSRIFPAKNLIYQKMRLGAPLVAATDGARQALEYQLGDYVVLGASNSGQTKEVVALFNRLQEQGHQERFGLTANGNAKLGTITNRCFVLACGKEDAVAATKSVAEQGLFYRSLLAAYEDGGSPLLANQEAAADAARTVLEMEIDAELVAAIAQAPVIYFAGRNNGVAEELRLKTNEITRKKSDYLEGTYAVHGIEEVMDRREVVIVVDPFEAETEKLKQVLVDGVGMKVIALSSQPTPFPTVRIPTVEGYDTLLQLLAGWNLLVSVGLALDINLDKPQRARKVGNEWPG